MRSEKEMFDLILNVAKRDARIRSVYMNGSRANTKVTKDIFQDYDIVYVVTKTKPFYENENWIDCFGKRLYMQMPEKMAKTCGLEHNFENTYSWLIMFEDFNRLDLHVNFVDFAKSDILRDKLCKVLLDKDSLFADIPESSDADYCIKKPTKEDFSCECNEFWWCLNNVAKGLWRKEIPYVMDMLNDVIRPSLIKILSWKIGFENNFSCNIGKSGKCMHQFLSENIWERFLETYSDSNVEHIWRSVIIMCDLFSEIAREVAGKLNFIYNEHDEFATRKYLGYVY